MEKDRVEGKEIMKKIVWLLLGISAAGAFGEEDVFSYKIGNIDVYMLVETAGPGNPRILLGVDEALRGRYLKPDFQSAVNVFLIKGPGGIVLVDTGFGGKIFDSMKSLGVKPGDVDVVLLTHMHGDHIGGLARDGRALFPKALVYVGEKEKEYWTVTNPNQGVIAALAPYGNRVRTFRPGELGGPPSRLAPGIEAVAAYGHTPGHSCFLIRSGDAQLLIFGDLVHVQDVQFPLPGVSVSYDVDPAMAAETRKRVLRYAAEHNIPVAGMHLVYPAIGGVNDNGEGGYVLIPAR
ncbi:MAG: MBL fold metallo-hydrolase [Spirochaetaceae bacterium]|jgi:glyoxylase-like metal-dependent hydrolase (beta-lactamase superfamily II)|nr:MBL fold metallo-hydrolase [Spirochaetaceae bacterium]